MVTEKRRIIKEKAGELAHIDCRNVSRDTIANDNKRYYLLCVLDSCSRIAWAEVMCDIKALSAMFSSMLCFSEIAKRYSIQFEEALTRKEVVRPEFEARISQQKAAHPFERPQSHVCWKWGLTHRC